MREPHLLDAPTKTTIPRRLIFFDSESRVQVRITEEEIDRARAIQEGKQAGESVRKYHEPRIIQATFWRKRDDRNGKIVERDEDYTRENRSGDFIEHFWRDVDKFTPWGQSSYVFAHNGKYDAQVTGAVPYLVDLGYILRFFSDSNPFVMQFAKETTYKDINGEDKKKSKKIFLISSTNYYQASLKQLGKTFKLPKLDFDHDNVDYDDPETMKKALIYGRRDVEILKTAMLTFISFVEREGLGKFSKTVAGQAFNAYRHRFMDKEIHIHDNQDAIDVERRAYAGGRNECFSMGDVKGWIYYVDINSMYPHVMKSKLYPSRLVSFWKRSSVENVASVIASGMLVCSDCLVETDYPIYHYKRNKLIFPTGSFWTSLSTPEIEEGLRRGIIKDVKNVAVYEGSDLFASYVDYYYTERLKAKATGDEIHDYLYKLFMNSLYGKFGQKNENWEVLLDDEGKEIEFDPKEAYSDMVREKNEDGIYRSYEIKVFGGRGFKKNDNEDDAEAFNSFPAVAAHVTAYARMLLWSYIEAAGKHVHYCDTDSLFVDGIGYEKLRLMGALDDKRLGALKLEGFANDLQLFGCKDYYFSKKVKMKGVSKNAIPLGKNAEGKLQFAITVWGGFAKRIKEGNLSTYYNEVGIKTLKRNYDKGTISAGRVSPFRLTPEIEKSEDDKLLAMCRVHGYIQPPNTAWYKALPDSVKRKYFSMRGIPIDEWEAKTGLRVNTLTLAT